MGSNRATCKLFFSLTFAIVEIERVEETRGHDKGTIGAIGDARNGGYRRKHKDTRVTTLNTITRFWYRNIEN